MNARIKRRPDVVIWQSGADTKIRVGRSAATALPLAAPQDIRRVVEQFLKSVECARPQGVEVPIKAARGFIRVARQAAYDCFLESTNGLFDDVGEIIGKIGSHIRSRTRPGASSLVEIVVNDSEYLPWEWLAEPISRQTLNVDAVDAVDSVDSVEAVDEESDAPKLLQEATDILGFSAVTRRVLLKAKSLAGAESSQGYLVPRDNTLQVRYVRHSGLPGASQQEGYFNSLGSVIKLVGPVPDNRLGLAIDLAPQLLDPRMSSMSTERRLSGLDQVVHIHCHHEAALRFTDDADTSMISKLVLSDVPVHVEVQFADLLAGLNIPAVRRRLGKMDRPLVFLNACRGDFHPLSTQSFSRLLVRNGNRGVISTSIKVPDQVAARFARLFYDKLFWGSGMTVGGSLLQAKLELLKRFHNPLGILYTYAGDPDLIVLPPLTAAVQAELPI